MMMHLRTLLVACLAMVAARPALAELRLEVLPGEIVLDGPAARHGLVVLAVDGASRQDVSGQVALEVRDAAICKLDGRMLAPVADGKTELLVTLDAQQARVPVEVRHAQEARPVSFLNDMVPILTRQGCNQGACHGKNAGQNGFRLSLRGYAPEMDHEWMTREFAARRISLARPEDSLILRKGLAQVPHGGGQRLREGSRAHQTILAWLHAGAPGPVAEDPKIERLEVLPTSRSLQPKQQQKLLARAHYSDGTVRDVTWLAQFESNDAGLVSVSPAGLATAVRNGETAVRVSFQGLVEIATFSVPYQRQIDAAAFAQRNNFIDEHVFGKLAELKIEPSPLADDAEFIRRAFLDTIGTLPQPEEVRTFLADKRPDKRARLIDSLLARPEYNDFWALQLADLLQNRKERDHDVRGTKGVRAFHYWLREQVVANKPWDKLAREVLVADGNTTDNPALGYYVVTVGEERNPERSEVVSSVAQAFLGTRIGCAKCHNHPLEKYTQDDYYHFAAFFSRMKFDRKKPADGCTSLEVSTQELAQAEKQLERAQEQLEKRRQEGDERKIKQGEEQVAGAQRRIDELRQRPVGVNQPRTGKFMAAQPLDRHAVEIPAGDDPRQALASWITSPDNQYFAGAMVNRMWKHFLAVGLVEPVDDLRATNPPSNPALWNALVREFIDHKYDLRHLMKVILNSRTYQLASATRESNQTESRFYSHYYARRLPAEVLMDAICSSTGVPDRFPGYPVGIRAIQLPDPGVDSYFLGLFGRSGRVTACACEREGDVTLPQLLNLQNGDNVLSKIRSGDGRLNQLLKETQDDRHAVESLFLATLSRPPDDDQLQSVLTALSETDDRTGVYHDLFWALLNSKEFTFNH